MTKPWYFNSKNKWLKYKNPFKHLVYTAWMNTIFPIRNADITNKCVLLMNLANVLQSISTITIVWFLKFKTFLNFKIIYPTSKKESLASIQRLTSKWGSGSCDRSTGKRTKFRSAGILSPRSNCFSELSWPDIKAKLSSIDGLQENPFKIMLFQ